MLYGVISNETKYKLDSLKANKISFLVGKMIVRDNLPISFI